MSLVVKGVLILIVVSATQATSASQPLPFETATVAYETVSREQVIDGVVEAVKQTTVSAQTTGRVAEILYDVDDYVSRGTIIARLTDEEQRAGYERAQANLRETQARLKEAQAEFARVQEIYERKLVSKAEFDKVTAERESARARLEAAEAALNEAKQQLAYTQVRAPYSGIVTRRHVELGETVTAGQPVMTGISLDELRVAVDVPQRLINQIRVISQAQVILPDAPGVHIGAARLTFFPYADSRTNTFKVRVYLPEGVKGLFPGMFVKVAFTIGQRRQLVVPTQAVVYRSEVTGTYVVGDGRVSFRQLRVGHPTQGNKIVVLAGLAEGERVALDPLRAGRHIKEQQVGARDE